MTLSKPFYPLFTICSTQEDKKPPKMRTKVLTLNAPIATKVVCFSPLLKCLKASMANSMDPDQTPPIGAVCSGSTLFASILNSPLMLGNHLQQTTSANDIFRCIFFLAL